MNRNFLIVFILLLSVKTFGQDKSNKKLIDNYNNWLKIVKLDSLIKAVEVVDLDTVKSGLKSVFPDKKVIVGKRKVIMKIVPADNIDDSQDFATAWVYVKRGLLERNIDINQLLLQKFADYTPIPYELLEIVVQTDNSFIFSLEISADSGVSELINEIRGGELIINYDFNNPGINSLIKNTYSLRQPIQDVSLYLDQISKFLKSSKRLPDQQVNITVRAKSAEMIEIEASNIFGHATKRKYYERIILTLRLNKSTKPVELEYWGTVFCAAGFYKATEYVDAASEPDIQSNLRLYNKVIDQALKKIFYGKI